ncbi:hypothetical protein [Flavobacterium sp. YJ01]|uniref:hypothetical protein n=1 Tax=unclassified Flavobacterium TaxID=196869 RepID=UPI0023E35479|nr:hypothetical protein [Flavobacterium sp. YJ01]WET03021.1 hypothetical protein P0R33_01560 [Flavobacterium sp. YJ01]
MIVEIATPNGNHVSILLKTSKSHTLFKLFTNEKDQIIIINMTLIWSFPKNFI